MLLPDRAKKREYATTITHLKVGPASLPAVRRR
jgi:hypothetical protein